MTRFKNHLFLKALKAHVESSRNLFGSGRLRFSSFLLIESILRLCTNLVASVLVAKHLGPEGYGYISYLFVVTSVFLVFSKLGLDSLIIRDLNMSPHFKDSILSNAFVVKIIGSILLFVIMNCLAYALSSNYIPFFFLSIILVISPLDLVETYLKGYEKFTLITLGKILLLVISLCLKIIFIYYSLDLNYFIGAYILDAFLLALLMLFLNYTGDNNVFKLKYDRGGAYKTFLESLPLMLSSVAVILYMKIDQVMIVEILGNEQNGLYSVVVRLTESLIFVTTSITAALNPFLTRLFRRNKVDFRKYYISLLRVLFILGLMLALFLAVFSDLIIDLTFGYEYVKSREVLRIYSWSIIFIFMNNASWIWIVNRNCQKFALYKVIFGMCLNIVLNYFWLPVFGIMGAAYSTLITYFLVSILLNLFFEKLRELFFLQIKSIALFYDTSH